MLDAIIVGGGPAGLSAALVLGRSRRHVVLLDAGQPAPASVVDPVWHNVFTRDGTPASQLRAYGLEQLAAYPHVRARSAEVTNAGRCAQGSGFEVRLSDGGVERARRLVLATGLECVLPAVEGVKERWGISVFHCPLCYARKADDKRVAVIGKGAGALRTVRQLARFAAQVVWCRSDPSEAGEPLAQLPGVGPVVVRDEPVLRVKGPGTEVEAVTFSEGEPEQCEAVFVPQVLRQRAVLHEQLGCAVWPDETVLVNVFGQTTARGVYAVGEMARTAAAPSALTTVITSAASGTVAGSALDQDLLTVDCGLPDPFAGMEPTM
ncbi:NAD(P)/FAD-dependent oxidoreductase [Streptomyces sp. NPDC002779]|uniref:NAD(P)/FAD-dependent oxidoreductase n=1 Tax=Streptomyces sp. NPDC002779 TaxID=3364664 RepID=UPI0036A0051B